MEQDWIKMLLKGGTAAASAVNPVAAGLSLAPELSKGALAASQWIRGRQLQKAARRPVYSAPNAAVEALDTQRNMMGTAPGAQQAATLADRSAGSSIGAIQASGGGMGEKMAALQGVSQQGQETALRQSAIQDQWSAQQAAALQGQLANMAQYQDKAFIYNKDEPFKEMSAKAAELGNAGNTNFEGALSGAGGAIASTIGYDAQKGVPTVDPQTGLMRQTANTGMAGDAASKIIGSARIPVNAKNPLVSQKVGHVATVDANGVTPQYQPFDQAEYTKSTGLPPVMIRSKDARMGFKDQTIENPDLNFKSSADIKKSLKFNPNTGQMDYDFNSIPPYRKNYLSVADPLRRLIAGR